MLNLSELLNKYRNLIKDDGQVKKKISLVFKEVLNFEVDANQIEIRQKLILIKPGPNPSFKSEIFLKKGEILKKINQETKLFFSDIRF